MGRGKQQWMNIDRSCNNSMLSENEQGAHPKQQLQTDQRATRPSNE